MKTTWPKLTYPVRPVMKFIEYARVAKTRRPTRTVSTYVGAKGPRWRGRAGRQRSPTRWARVSAPMGASSEDSFRPKEEDRDHREESDRIGDGGPEEDLPDVEDDAEGQPANEASPHLARPSQHDDHVADRRIERPHVRVDARREEDGQEGAAGHRDAERKAGPDCGDGRRIDAHQLGRGNVLAVRPDRISQVRPAEEDVGRIDDRHRQHGHVNAAKRDPKKA